MATPRLAPGYPLAPCCPAFEFEKLSARHFVSLWPCAFKFKPKLCTARMWLTAPMLFCNNVLYVTVQYSLQASHTQMCVTIPHSNSYVAKKGQCTLL